jgi:N-acetylglutamate synthase and related acetyltransferases
MVDGYSISDNKNKLDIQVIHHFLNHSYWAKNIPIETVQRSIDNSFCVGIYDASDVQVAFARVITDFATFAYLGDVFVVENHRKKGLSKWLVKFIVEHPLLQGLRRLLLVTADAHGLYQQFGFQPITQSENYLSIHNPNIYLNT